MGPLIHTPGLPCSDRDPACPCWVHDLAVTRNHVVIVESPMFISLPALMSMADSEYIFMDWRPEQGTRVHVVPLNENMGVSRGQECTWCRSMRTWG